MATGLGMQLFLLRPPGEKSDPRFPSSLIFAGNLVVLQDLLILKWLERPGVLRGHGWSCGEYSLVHHDEY
ncbi:MAG TPA: hypothetical protein GX711_04830 [Clostridia bacterium]|nr:hypothetical protein [Clostridia bacterium]